MKRSLLLLALVPLTLYGAAAALWLATRDTVVVSSVAAPMPTPSPNGYDFFVRAAALAGHDDKVADSLLRRGLKMPCVWPTTRGPLQELTPKAKALRELSRHMATRSTGLQKSGATDQVKFSQGVELGLDAMDMGARLPRGGGLVPLLLSEACRAIGDRAINNAPAQANVALAKKSARRLQGILERRVALADIYREDQHGMQSRLLTALDQAAHDNGFSPRSFHPIPNAIRVGEYYDMTRCYDAAIADTKNSYVRSNKNPSSPLRWAGAIMGDPLMRARFNYERGKVTTQMLAVRFALRAYRLEHGAYPKKLKELVPQYLAKVPLDAYGDGEELHYSKNEIGFTLWSRGTDGIDNGGRPILNKRGKRPRFYGPESLGDVVEGTTR